MPRHAQALDIRGVPLAFAEVDRRRHVTSPRGRRRRIGSAGRLALLHAGVLAVALGVVTVALVRSFSASFEAAAANDLGGQLREFQQSAVTRASNETLRAFSIHFLQTHPLASGETVIISIAGQGLVVTGTSAPLVADARIAGWFTKPPTATVTFSETLGGVPLELVAAPIRSGTRFLGTYIAASDLRPFVAERSRVLGLSLAEAAIALAVGVASAFFLLRRLLRTIGRITETAEEIGAGRLDQRLGSQQSEDEVGELARTFDAMLDHMALAMSSQRRLLADVSHQLRTPLTVVRGHLEVLARTGADDETAVRETIELVVDELDHMRVLIDRLLTLGRAMEPDLLSPARFALGEFLPAIIEAVNVIAPRDFVLGAYPDLLIEADREQLRGAIVNLIENSVHATNVGDRITLGAELDASSGELAIVVEDAGPGIPAAERTAALQRFSRPGARDEGGSGLGLAIAKAVAMAHGGSISIDQSALLKGARVAIVLPLPSVVVESVAADEDR